MPRCRKRTALHSGLHYFLIINILIEDFLTASEVALLVNGFRNLPLQEKTVINDGFVSYPLSFAQFTQQKNSGQITVEEYVTIAERLNEKLINFFGINITDKLCSFLKQFKLSFFTEF